jgi:hypothetical protein
MRRYSKATAAAVASAALNDDCGGAATMQVAGIAARGVFATLRARVSARRAAAAVSTAAPALPEVEKVVPSREVGVTLRTTSRSVIRA